MKSSSIVLSCFCVVVFTLVARSHVVHGAGSVRAAKREHQDELEKLLLSVPDPKRLRDALYHLTKKSHVAGTKGDWENAYYVRDKLIEFGFDAAIQDIPVMMTYPLERPRLTASFGYHAKLSEDVIEEDVTSGTTEWRNHTFLAYSPSGKVTAKLVYANYGRPQDFEQLDALGVSVQNAVVIMRYGKCFRGLKIMNAEQRGGIGSIIYTDPQEDGFTKGPTFPDGPWRPPSSVQRGSVQYNSRCAGDPWRIYLKDKKDKSTVKDTCGYETEELIPSHPALPLSYEDAKPLLEQLGGPVGPSDFQGGLPISYTVGPSKFDVTMETNHTFYVRRIPNVIAKMNADDIVGNISSTVKDAPSIILGNHRDAWVFGAVDPNSGTTALLEVARTLQVLRNQGGWKPKRNIILASWSGEEYGLLGSTAYAELNAEKSKNFIAYLNVDSAVSGNVSFDVSATHSLEPLIRRAAETVPAPPAPERTGSNSGNRTMADVWNKIVGTLGSGSDYTAFLDRYGISSVDMKFDGNYGVYHSVYDSFSWMEQQGDPTFEIHQAMTRMWALMAFRLASTDILPIYMTPQAVQMKRDIKALAETIQQQDIGANLDLRELEEASDLFHQAAIDIDMERDVYEQSMAFDGESLETADINRRLTLVERQFLGPGLPKRPWFRHILQSPGYYLGYGSQAFPGIAQAIDDGDFKAAQSEVSVAATAVIKAASFLVKGEEILFIDGDEESSQFDH